MARRSRILLVAAAMLAVSVLGVARWVEPDGRGYGTHEQLGLPPCAFRALTGIPCPSCGMTTSFAHVVRGRLWDATRTNPGGCLLALGVAGMIPWCLSSAVLGRPLGIRSPERAIVAAVLFAFGFSIVAWVIRFLFFRGQG